LGVFVLRNSDDLTGLIKNHAAGAGGALVNGEDVSAHIYNPSHVTTSSLERIIPFAFWMGEFGTRVHT
jgi:hypothetical protein